MMRERSFQVPADLIVEFAEVMGEYGFDNVIDGVTEDGEIEIRVDYEPEHKNVINKLHDMIDDHKDNQEDDDEDDGEDNEDED